MFEIARYNMFFFAAMIGLIGSAYGSSIAAGLSYSWREFHFINKLMFPWGACIMFLSGSFLAFSFWWFG